jgi:hypothetical protein
MKCAATFEVPAPRCGSGRRSKLAYTAFFKMGFSRNDSNATLVSGKGIIRGGNLRSLDLSLYHDFGSGATEAEPNDECEVVRESQPELITIRSWFALK